MPDETLTGPGLKRSARPDPVMVTSLVFAVLCLIPSFWFRSTFGVHAFGPIAFPAILAIVAVLFGFLGVFRGMELEDARIKRWSAVGVAVGLVRLLIYPLLGW